MKIVHTNNNGETTYDYPATLPDKVNNYVIRGGSNGRDYKSKLGQRQCTTTLHAGKTFVKMASCSGKVVWMDGGIENTYEISGPVYLHDYTSPGLVQAFEALAENRQNAVTKLKSKIYELQRGEFAGGVFLAELAETIRMIQNPVMGIKKAVQEYGANRARLLKWFNKEWEKLLREGASVSRREALTRIGLKKANELYLTWTYGVAPLFGDIDSLIKAVAQLSRKREVQTLRSKATDNIDNPGSSGVFVHPGFTISYRTVSTSETSARAMCSVDVNSDIWAEGPKWFGTRLHDFVPTLWEAAPYSFLVDYLANVGQYLESEMACTSACRWDVIGTKIKTTTTIFVDAEPSTVGPTKSFSFSCPPLTVIQEDISRSPINYADTGLTTKWPSLRQYVNIAALIKAIGNLH